MEVPVTLWCFRNQQEAAEHVFCTSKDCWASKDGCSSDRLWTGVSELILVMK